MDTPKLSAWKWTCLRKTFLKLHLKHPGGTRRRYQTDSADRGAPAFLREAKIFGRAEAEVSCMGCTDDFTMLAVGTAGGQVRLAQRGARRARRKLCLSGVKRQRKTTFGARATRESPE